MMKKPHRIYWWSQGEEEKKMFWWCSNIFDNEWVLYFFRSLEGWPANSFRLMRSKQMTNEQFHTSTQISICGIMDLQRHHHSPQMLDYAFYIHEVTHLFLIQNMKVIISKLQNKCRPITKYIHHMHAQRIESHFGFDCPRKRKREKKKKKTIKFYSSKCRK